MSKKAKRGSTNNKNNSSNLEVYSSSSSAYAVADDDGARSKYQGLLQDYHDLFNEAEAKKRALQKMNQKNLRLFNEVRFLRKRYRKLMKNPSQQNQCVLLKRQSISIKSKLRKHASSEVGVDAVPAETPSTSIEAFVDLNQSSFQNGNTECEGDKEYYLMQGDQKENANYNNMYGEEEETTLACRDLGGTSSSRPRKRKISWQDQFALQV